MHQKSGKETREQMLRYVDETTEATLEFNESVKNLKDAVTLTRKTVDETIPVVKESFTKDFESFKFQAQPRIERIKTHVDRLNQHVTTIQAKSVLQEEISSKYWRIYEFCLKHHLFSSQLKKSVV